MLRSTALWPTGSQGVSASSACLAEHIGGIGVPISPPLAAERAASVANDRRGGKDRAWVGLSKDTMLAVLLAVYRSTMKAWRAVAADWFRPIITAARSSEMARTKPLNMGERTWEVSRSLRRAFSRHCQFGLDDRDDYYNRRM